MIKWLFKNKEVPLTKRLVVEQISQAMTNDSLQPADVRKLEGLVYRSYKDRAENQGINLVREYTKLMKVYAQQVINRGYFRRGEFRLFNPVSCPTCTIGTISYSPGFDGYSSSAGEPGNARDYYEGTCHQCGYKTGEIEGKYDYHHKYDFMYYFDSKEGKELLDSLKNRAIDSFEINNDIKG